MQWETFHSLDPIHERFLIATLGGFYWSAMLVNLEESAAEEKGTLPCHGVTFTIVYDNNQSDQRLTSAWGFSCLIEFPDRTILFDTGGESALLFANVPLKINTCGKKS